MHTGCITILDFMQLLICIQVTICINAAKLQLCVLKQTVGVGYVHKDLDEHVHRLGVC